MKCRKDENKQDEAGIDPFFKTLSYKTESSCGQWLWLSRQRDRFNTRGTSFEYCHRQNFIMNILTVGSGCGSVGRGIAFETRGPSFESSHWQHFKMNKLTFNC